MENTGNTYDYAHRFADVSEIKCEERTTPKAMIGKWEKLIAEIEEGYNWEPEELKNDLESTRGEIENLLSEDSLNDYEEHGLFKKIIAHLDTKFKNLTVVDPLLRAGKNAQWWNNRILKNGGEKYRKVQ